MNFHVLSYPPHAACGLLIALALLNGAAPARAASVPVAPVAAVSAAPVFAENEYSFTRFLKSISNRNRVVQLCVVCMLLALFIIIKKLDSSPTIRAAMARRRNCGEDIECSREDCGEPRPRDADILD
jgi:hypothetical protein